MITVSVPGTDDVIDVNFLSYVMRYVLKVIDVRSLTMLILT